MHLLHKIYTIVSKTRLALVVTPNCEFLHTFFAHFFSPWWVEPDSLFFAQPVFSKRSNRFDIFFKASFLFYFQHNGVSES